MGIFDVAAVKRGRPGFDGTRDGNGGGGEYDVAVKRKRAPRRMRVRPVLQEAA